MSHRGEEKLMHEDMLPSVLADTMIASHDAGDQLLNQNAGRFAS